MAVIHRLLILSALLAVSGATLGGCVAMNAAATVSSATVGAANAVGRAATQTAASVSRSVSQIPAAMMYGPGVNRRIVIPLSRTQPQPVMQRSVTQRRSAPSRPRVTRRSAAAPETAPKAATTRAETFLEVLPPELLDQLTQDQVNLQTLVQAEALAGAADETVFWELDGRAGTARAEAPHALGAFTCRAMIETIKLGETATESRATACRTNVTGWTLSF